VDWRRAVVGLLVVVAATSVAGCGGADGGRPDAAVPTAAHVALGEDRVVADAHVDPLVRCNGWRRCTDAGFLYGLRSASVSRVSGVGGWALELKFDPLASPDATHQLQQELERRAHDAGLPAVRFLDDADEWPSCAGSDGCPTVRASREG
jgi:hypothetical protein